MSKKIHIDISVNGRTFRAEMNAAGDAVDDFATRSEKSTKKASHEMANYTKEMGKVGSQSRGLSSTLKVLSGGFAALGLGSLASDAMNTFRSFESMSASLKTMTGSTEAASAAFDEIEQFAKTTPYNLEQSVQGFIKLKALGLDPSMKSLESYGNTASAMGKDLMQMIEAVADASTGEFERLKEFGIKSKKEGENVSFTFQGVTTTIKASSENIQQYLKNIGDQQFAGAMADQMATVNGAVSNAQDSYAAFQRTLIETSGAGELFKSALGSIAGSLAYMTTGITTLADDWAFFVDDLKYGDGIFETLRNSVKLAGSAFSFIADKLSFLSGPLEAIAEAFLVVGTAMGGSIAVYSAVAAGIGLVGTAFAAMGAIVMANPLVAIVTAVATIAYAIYENWDGIADWFGNIWHSMTESAKAFLSWWNSTTFEEKVLDINTSAIAVGEAAAKKFAGWWEQSTLREWAMKISPDGVAKAESIGRKFLNWWKTSSLAEKALVVVTPAIAIAKGVASKFFGWWSGTKLGKWTADVKSELLEKAWTLAKKFVGWWNGLKLKSLIPEIKMPSFGDLKKKASKIGTNIADGVSEGITAGKAKAKKAVNSISASIMGAFRSFWNTHSPSVLARDEIGFNVGAGVGLGIEKSSSFVVGKIVKFNKKLKDEMQESVKALNFGREKTLIDLEKERLAIGKNAIALYELSLKTKEYGANKLKLSSQEIAYRVGLKQENLLLKKQVEAEREAAQARKSALKSRNDAIESMQRKIKGWELGFKLVKNLTVAESKQLDEEKKTFELRKKAQELAQRINNDISDRIKKVRALSAITNLSANAISIVNNKLNGYTLAQSRAKLADEQRINALHQLATINDKLNVSTVRLNQGADAARLVELAQQYGDVNARIIQQEEQRLNSINNQVRAWDSVKNALIDVFDSGKAKWSSLRDALLKPLTMEMNVKVNQAAGDITRTMQSVFNGSKSVVEAFRGIKGSITGLFKGTGGGFSGAINSYQIGSGLAKALGGNAAVQMGAGIGGAIGSFVPVIGNMLGSLFGGLIGSLFSRGPKVRFNQSFNKGQTAENHNDGRNYGGSSVFGNFGLDQASKRFHKLSNDAKNAVANMIKVAELSDKNIANLMTAEQIKAASKDLASEGLRYGNNSADIKAFLIDRLKRQLKQLDPTLRNLIKSSGDYKAQLIAINELGKIKSDILPMFDAIGIAAGKTSEQILESFKQNDFLSAWTEQFPADALAEAERQAQEGRLAIVYGWGEKLKLEGETVSQALTRSAQNFAVVSTAANNMNMPLNLTGVALLEAGNQMVEFAGGLEAFANKSEFVYQKFFTQAEREAKAKEAATAAIAEYNNQFAGLDITSRETFRQIIDSIDLSTEAGRRQYAALLDVAQATDTLYPALENLADATDGAAAGTESVAEAARKLKEATAQYNDYFLGINQSLEDARAVVAGLGLTTDNLKQSYIDLVNSASDADREALILKQNAVRLVVEEENRLARERQRAIEEQQRAQQREAEEARRNAEKLAREQQRIYEEHQRALQNVKRLTTELADLQQQLADLDARIAGGGTTGGASQEEIINAQIDAQRTILDGINDQIGAEKNRISEINRSRQEAYNDSLRYWEAQQQAAQKGREYLESLKLDNNLTNLTPMEQLAEAQSQYQQALNSGDADSAQAAMQKYLALARNAYGSSDQYNQILNNSKTSFESLLNSIEGQEKPTAPAILIATDQLNVLNQQKSLAEQQIRLLQQQLDTARDSSRTSDLEAQRADLAARIKAKMNELKLAKEATQAGLPAGFGGAINPNLVDITHKLATQVAISNDLPSDIRSHLASNLNAIKNATDKTQMESLLTTTRNYINSLPTNIRTQLDPRLLNLVDIKTGTAKESGHTTAWYVEAIARRTKSNMFNIAEIAKYLTGIVPHRFSDIDMRFGNLDATYSGGLNNANTASSAKQDTMISYLASISSYASTISSNITTHLYKLGNIRKNLAVQNQNWGKSGNGKGGIDYYAKGGIANKASIFGEAGPEAAVPLPDGRSIPVTLSYDEKRMARPVIMPINKDAQKDRKEQTALIKQLVQENKKNNKQINELTLEVKNLRKERSGDANIAINQRDEQIKTAKDGHKIDKTNARFAASKREAA